MSDSPNDFRSFVIGIISALIVTALKSFFDDRKEKAKQTRELGVKIGFLRYEEDMKAFERRDPKATVKSFPSLNRELIYGLRVAEIAMDTELCSDQVAERLGQLNLDHEGTLGKYGNRMGQSQIQSGTK